MSCSDRMANLVSVERYVFSRASGSSDAHGSDDDRYSVRDICTSMGQKHSLASLHDASAHAEKLCNTCMSSALPIPFHKTTANALAACSRCNSPFFNSPNSLRLVLCASRLPRQTLWIFLAATSSLRSRSLACRSALARAMTLSGEAAELLPRLIRRVFCAPWKLVKRDILRIDRGPVCGEGKGA